MKKIIKALDVFFNNRTVKYLVVYSIVDGTDDEN
ncbi:hypothetical protein EV196_10559 [Mariniflexile fucanivorans]|uniref:Uncharacterized protein n=1 Tax=Mariniflexile fucanivorans TaxID=264023 RepID=A0A4R1RH87_9FLAO|nr:hypothetical protein EV196_10559 [Mariniflexile fucanivorans]